MDSISIYDAMQNIENGAYLIPAFQREYVWNLRQIEKLWDSILLGYPIATFLFWHIDEKNTTNDTYFYNFLRSGTFRKGVVGKNETGNTYTQVKVDLSKTNTAVLDGQQRLTSLYLSLYGDVNILGKNMRASSGGYLSKLVVELNQQELIDTLSDEEGDNDACLEQIYDIKFTSPDVPNSPTQFEVKKLVAKDNKFKSLETRAAAIQEAIVRVPASSRDYATSVLNKLCAKIYDEKLINFTELTDLFQPAALEVFVRFNAGGTKLRKNEITNSILHSYDPTAKQRFRELLSGPYARFDTGFLMRAALMLFGDVVTSNIDEKMAYKLKNGWDDFKTALTNMAELLAGMNIKVERFANSWNILLPILYSIYYNPNYKDDAVGIKTYIIRSVLLKFFQSGTTGKLNKIRGYIKNNDYKITVDRLNMIPELNVTDANIEDLLNSEKNGRIAKEVLRYLALDWANPDECNYEADHLHPDTGFDFKPYGLSSDADWNDWRQKRNKLPNLQWLVKHYNSSKNSTPLLDYYNGLSIEEQTEFRTQAMIPDGVSFELKDFGEFYDARKELLRKKLKEILMID